MTIVITIGKLISLHLRSIVYHSHKRVKILIVIPSMSHLPHQALKRTLKLPLITILTTILPIQMILIVVIMLKNHQKKQYNYHKKHKNGKMN